MRAAGPTPASWAWVPSGHTGLAPSTRVVEADIAPLGETLGTNLQEAPTPQRPRPLEPEGVAPPGSAQGLSGSSRALGALGPWCGHLTAPCLSFPSGKGEGVGLCCIGGVLCRGGWRTVSPQVASP